MDPATRDHVEALLLKAARAYGVQASRDEVQRAIDDAVHGPAFAKWATLHLVSDNLLSPGELALYTALDTSGQVDRLAALHDFSEVQAVTEEDLRVAVDELRQSTARISQQTETLRQQHGALSRLVKERAESSARRRELDASTRQRAEIEQRQLATEVEELSQNLALRLSDLDQQGRDAETNLHNVVGAIFESDDKLLASLQKLGWELDQPDPDETQMVEKARELCMRLIEFVVETARTRLDTLYLDSLVAAEQSGGAKPAAIDKVKTLEEEIESLYSEILPVAQMSVGQLYLNPAIKLATSKSDQSLSCTAASLAYINDCLDYLLDRTARLHIHVEGHKSREAISAALAFLARSEMSADVSCASSSPVSKPSPIRILTNPAGSQCRRRSSSIGQEEPPLDILFRNLSLPAPCLNDEDGKKQVAMLSSILAERSQKALDIARGAQDSFEQSTIAQLQDVRRAVQLVTDCLLAESPFGDVQLVDPEVEASIVVLEQEVGKAREKLRAVESLMPLAKSDKREEIVRRFLPSKYRGGLTSR